MLALASFIISFIYWEARGLTAKLTCHGTGCHGTGVEVLGWVRTVSSLSFLLHVVERIPRTEFESLV